MREHSFEEVRGWGPHLLVKERISYTLWGRGGDTLRVPLYAMMDRVKGVPPESLCSFVSVVVDGKPVHLAKPEMQEAGGRFRFAMSVPIVSTAGRVAATVTTRKRIPPTDRWNSFATMPTHGFALTFRYRDVEEKRNEPQLDLYCLGARRGPLRLAPKAEGDGFKRWEYPGWLYTNQSWALAWAPDTSKN